MEASVKEELIVKSSLVDPFYILWNVGKWEDLLIVLMEVAGL